MTDITIAPTGSRQIAVASQWQLMWWAFRRHRLAMIGLGVTILLYMIALVPGFFATNDPFQQNGRAAYHPPQAIHFIDVDASGSSWTLRPYFHPGRLTRDPVSLAAVYKPDTGRKVAISFFGEGYENANTNDKQPWSFWRIEGPGFVWNFRVLPHVHTYVNISAKA